MITARVPFMTLMQHDTTVTATTMLIGKYSSIFPFLTAVRET